MLFAGVSIVSLAVANPANASDFNRTSNDLSRTEQFQTNVTTQDSLGIINQRGGANYNFQNNNSYDPLYSKYGKQACAQTSLFAKVHSHVNDSYDTTTNIGGEIGINVPLSDGGCNRRIKETHCIAIIKAGFTNPWCQKESGLMLITDTNPAVIKPE